MNVARTVAAAAIAAVAAGVTGAPSPTSAAPAPAPAVLAASAPASSAPASSAPAGQGPAAPAGHAQADHAPAAPVPAGQGPAAPALAGQGPVAPASAGRAPAAPAPAGQAQADPAGRAPAVLSAKAAPPDPAKIEAVTEIEPDMWPLSVEYTVRPGEVVPAPLGVQSVDPRPVRGLVAQVEPSGDLEFARRYRNCWYTRGVGGEMAWCSFAVALAPYRTLAITAPMVAAEPGARPGRTETISFRWQSRAWADARGGLRKVVDFFAAPGAPIVAGSGGVLTLEARDLPTADIRTHGNHVAVHVVAGSPAPSATPTATATAGPTATVTPTATATGVGTAEPTPSTSPSAAAGGSGGAAGLPVTGPGTALAGLALLGAGVVGYLVTRRRRNRFVA